jgi:hypothetical protein
VTGDDIRIYNSLGLSQPVQSVIASDDLLEIDLSGYAAGIYFVKVNSGGKVHVSRVIKK